MGLNPGFKKLDSGLKTTGTDTSDVGLNAAVEKINSGCRPIGLCL